MARPSSYKPEYCEKLIEHMSQGMSFHSFAADCDVSAQCLYDWVMRYDDFAKAKAIAEVKCLRFWEKLNIAGAAGKVKNFNAATTIYNMKVRFRKYGWYENEQDDPKRVEDKSELVSKLLTQLTLLIQDKACSPTPLEKPSIEISSTTSQSESSAHGLLIESAGTS